MKLVVCDASVLIDLLKADVFSAFLRLSYKKHAPPNVIREVKETNLQLLTDAIETHQINLSVIEDLNEIRALMKKYSPHSFQDCTCLYTAIQYDSMLLTCERPLRKIAKQNYDLEVHGSLFIFDELLKANLLTFRLAHQRLAQLIKSGAYLPIDECNKRLRRWKRKF